MNVIVSLDGAVQGQGIKASVDDWLNIGSDSWGKTPNEIKAAAYQAAKVSGWKDAGLLQVIIRCWKMDEDMAKFTLETLKELEIQHPFQVDEIRKDESKPPVWKIKNCDKTLPFPEKT